VIDPPFRTQPSWTTNAWTPYVTPIVSVVDGVINNSYNYNGDYTVKIIDKEVIYKNIKHDFNNPLINVYDNSTCANKVFLASYTDETYVYLTYYPTTNDTIFQDAITNNKLIFCYYQSIIINNIWYHVTEIDKANFRIYIDKLSIDGDFENEVLCEVIISAANVNNINLVSNNHKLRTSHAIDYPYINYTYDKPARLTSLFKGSNNNKYCSNII
jgi:hypothetical protein